MLLDTRNPNYQAVSVLSTFSPTTKGTINYRLSTSSINLEPSYLIDYTNNQQQAPMADSTIYETLASTAKSFVHSCRPAESGTNKVRRDLILSHCGPNFRMDWGHRHFISTFPPLQNRKTADEWQDHMTGMAVKMETWEIEITDTIVDVEKKKVVVRGDFRMKVEGYDPVCNDIVFIMRMDEDGEKLVECTEFIDPVAGQELGSRMAKSG